MTCSGAKFPAHRQQGNATRNAPIAGPQTPRQAQITRKNPTAGNLHPKTSSLWTASRTIQSEFPETFRPGWKSPDSPRIPGALHGSDLAQQARDTFGAADRPDYGPSLRPPKNSPEKETGKNGRAPGRGRVCET